MIEILTSILIFVVIACITWSNSSNTDTYEHLPSQALPTPQPTLTPKLHAVWTVNKSVQKALPYGAHECRRNFKLSGICNSEPNKSIYQPANATRTGGLKDFSNWNFILLWICHGKTRSRKQAKYSSPNNRGLASFCSLRIDPSTSLNQAKIAGNVTTLPSN